MRARHLAMGGLIALLAFTGATAIAKKHHKRGAPRGPYPSLGSCQVFPKSTAAANAPAGADESAWNQNISQAPTDPNSAAIISFIDSHGGDAIHPDFGSPKQYGIPYAVTTNGRRSKVKFTAYGDESTHGLYRIPSNAPIEGGPHADGDRHVLSIETTTCSLQELFNAHKGKKRSWKADAGVIWDLHSAALRPDGLTSADAAGLPIFPGLARYDEAASGHIDHALRVTFDTTRNSFIHPATHCAGSTTSAAAPPMGTRLRLKSDYPTSGFTNAAAAIATAMKQYGLIVADNGSNWYVSGTSDRRWDDDNLNQLKAIPGSAFEVVQSAAPAHAC